MGAAFLAFRPFPLSLLSLTVNIIAFVHQQVRLRRWRSHATCLSSLQLLLRYMQRFPQFILLRSWPQVVTLCVRNLVLSNQLLPVVHRPPVSPTLALAVRALLLSPPPSLPPHALVFLWVLAAVGARPSDLVRGVLVHVPPDPPYINILRYKTNPLLLHPPLKLPLHHSILTWPPFLAWGGTFPFTVSRYFRLFHMHLHVSNPHLPPLSRYGLRVSALTHLRRLLPDPVLASITGHRNLATLAIYGRGLSHPQLLALPYLNLNTISPSSLPLLPLSSGAPHAPTLPTVPFP